MTLTNNIIINIYSILILLVIYHNTNKLDNEQKFNDKIFKSMIKLTSVLLFIDILSRFDGNPDSFYFFFNHVGNFFIFLLSPVLASLWLLYVHYQVFNLEKKTRKLIKPLIGINLLNAFLVVLNLFFGWFYYIDINNIYNRGPYFLVSTLFSVILILFASILIIRYRNNIGRKYYLSLALFAVPPLISIVLLILFYGISIVLNSIVLSLLIAFLYIQNKSMGTDHLTGLYNRKRFESYLKEKINSSTRNRTFSAIMLDINNFKTINDTFGHEMGDKALEVSGKLLKSSIRTNDFLARYGGDEFFLILDISNQRELKATINRINDKINEFNSRGVYPFELYFSMGYAIYDYKSKMGVNKFLKHIDNLMYEDKEEYRQSLLFK
ncbi:MAG: diguanylate cyclase [Fusobacteria bacterium]|nr:MAG: diguanylate cyclase [Fusobacteriota bacterium]KAF0229143.1 MAG: diguanylate [Fusobacteriota bacterium]